MRESSKRTEGVRGFICWGHRKHQEPLIKLKIGPQQQEFEFLVDTGAERSTVQVLPEGSEIVDCTCRTRLKGIRCDTFPVKYRNWDSYVKRHRVAPGDLLKNIPAAEKMVPPVARGNRVDGKGRGGKKLWLVEEKTPGWDNKTIFEELPQE
ncbi:hypothetical protein DUI87_06168 [Hirundo rustica rustica]|uniref:Peptidase A2 domain-containing protein n=1 Tax=Hirundo rustica rustica TaxID=333673 RepID=A0A3M0KUS4_HIRRU|nr:hypothetical protein DUI87_06168 [Hirundo rustica rustica]